jgi:hypothetical protein
MKEAPIYTLELERHFEIRIPRVVMKGRSMLKLSRSQFKWQRARAVDLDISPARYTASPVHPLIPLS